MGWGFKPTTGAKVVSTPAGKAVHAIHGRQPIVPNQGTGANPVNLPFVPKAAAIKNPLQRYPYGR